VAAPQATTEIQLQIHQDLECVYSLILAYLTEKEENRL
jgi:hypothetical protein